ncbi:hypothetical protein Nham_4468 (plasmid) [Nitrobacter hamburgensis X14]|uniref:Uncharacterized protein n=1 Tax=Nitrobacter hamburgensis (strain DSM 10229 / NCIMB 13809 / X14) TaxID=323097 RepID=Q1QFE7_NITHX|nr:hypothetical protein Nham_4468 [Nitrobacter hamburgensis X14]
MNNGCLFAKGWRRPLINAFEPAVRNGNCEALLAGAALARTEDDRPDVVGDRPDQIGSTVVAVGRLEALASGMAAREGDDPLEGLQRSRQPDPAGVTPNSSLEHVQ